MSYLINIRNKREVKAIQLLENRFVPQNVCVARGENRELPLEGFNRFYLPNKSSRGVALTVTDEYYAVELYIGASAADYHLGAKIAMAIAEINDATISPDFDDELSLADFESKYDEDWAYSSRLYEVESFLTHMVQKTGTLKLPGCIRGFYFGNYMLEKFKYDNPDEEVFVDRVIDAIGKVQFIEEEIEGIEVPALMDATFPEGVKTVLVILSGYKLLVQRSDYIILRLAGNVLRVEFEKFINYARLSLDRIDEEQYMLQPIPDDVYKNMMDYFSDAKDKTVIAEAKPEQAIAKKWQFWKK